MDIARHLPLSQRPQQDESGVTNDWSRATSTVLASAASALQSASPQVLAHSRAKIRDAVRELDPDFTELEGTDLERADLAAAIRALADRFSARTHRTTISELAVVLLGTWDLAEALDAPVDIDANVTGAVAIARAAGAGFEIRTVLRSVTLVASDDGWRVGFGPERHASAKAIVRFLCGRGDLPRD